MQERKMQVKHTPDSLSALEYLRREKKGGFDLSETCRTTIIRAAKKLGWKPDA